MEDSSSKAPKNPSAVKLGRLRWRQVSKKERAKAMRDIALTRWNKKRLKEEGKATDTP